MRLGLRMGLNSRQGGGGDLPSLDLAFALDKTLTARKGPTPAFTRVQATSTGSTYVGADGLIKYAAANESRFDHDPATGASKGLLIEESRTNLIPRSSELDHSAWTKERASVDPNRVAAPDGTITADKLVEDTSVSNSHRLLLTVNLPASVHTFSVFAKSSERNWVRVTLFDGVTARQVWFDVSAGVVGTQSGATGQMQLMDNGWWRCSVTATGVASATAQANIAIATADGILTYTGDGTSGLYLWGAQLEAGAFPTSYIPTTSGTAARSADVCSIIGDAFASFYNQVEGTIFIKGSTINPGNNAILYALSDGTISNFIQALPGTGSFTVVNSGGTQASLNHGNFVANIESAQASAYKLNDFASSKNGATSLIDTTGTVPTVSQLGIGSRLSSVQLNGHIARIQYFRKRLPNAKLQTLTAP